MGEEEFGGQDGRGIGMKKREMRKCRRCGSVHGLIKKYGLDYCRRCMREIAREIGFKKYG
jgi:small subunit ribosomal protein S14